MYNPLFKNYEGKGKIIIDLELITKEPLHIGATEKSIKIKESDLLCIKRNDGTPYIPGSSMRGMLRAYINRVSHFLNDQSILQKLGLKEIRTTHAGKNSDDIVCDLHGIFNKKGENDLKSLEQIAIDTKMICDICLLFGAMGYGSPLKITDFQPTGPVQLVNRNHIAIDLASDTTKGTALFFVESVAQDTSFKGKIIFEKRGHERQEQIMKLLEIIILYLQNQEIYIGGLKSRGYGFVKFTKIEIQEYSLEEEILGVKVSPIQIPIQ